jgi:hypothetical protein
MNIDFNSNNIEIKNNNNNEFEIFKDIPKVKNGEDIPKIKFNIHHNKSNLN